LPAKVSRLVKQVVNTDSSPSGLAEAFWFLWTESSIAATRENHNHYIYANELAWMNAISEGRSFMVGFKPRLENNNIYVREIIDETLQKQGLNVGDKISEITSRGFEAEGRFYWWTRLKPFNYRLHYHSEDDIRTIDAVSISFFQSSITTSIWRDIAYVHIGFFSKRTPVELWRFLRDLGPDVKSIIIDIRNNGGGIVSPEVIDYFLKPDQVVLAFRDMGHDLEILKGSVAYVPQPVIILLNHNSASMAELLAAALQKQGRALIVGERSYGKSVGQRTYPVGDEGAVMLVATHYFYPNGTDDWSKTGIIPDYPITLTPDEEAKISEVLLSGDIDMQALLKIDPQLNKAIELTGDS
jgi:carboxyl-terminal processing protease